MPPKLTPLLKCITKITPIYGADTGVKPDI